MKDEEFSQLFPEPDYTYFHIDADGEVLYGKDVEGKLLSLSSPSFWKDKNAVKKLGISVSDYTTYLRDPMNFLDEYKKLHNIKIRGEKGNETVFWHPIEWSYNNSPPPAIVLKKNNINLENFRIYVNGENKNNSFFLLKDSFLDFSDITKIDFKDEKNQYCVVLKIMYILSYLGGISLKNLNSDNKLASSFAHFYFYYHLKKFLNYRIFSQYDTSPVEELEWSLYSWATHFVWYHPQIHYTEKSLQRNKHDVIKNIKREGKRMKYQVRLGKRDISKDYLELIRGESSGLTKTGQILFQESCQAYVYCVLGSQAKTRWKIIGDGANSFQTQKVFMDLVDEVTSQNNLSILIKSMRLAISSTKVRLNFVISPGLDVLPSDMVYIKDAPGYNNILLVSNNNMKFGSNNVNNILKAVKKKIASSDEEKSKNSTLSQSPVKKETAVATYKSAPSQSNVPILLSASVIALLARVLWVAVL